MKKRKSKTAKTKAHLAPKSKPATKTTQHCDIPTLAVMQAPLDWFVHESAPVTSEPNKQIAHWGLYQFHFQNGTRSRHLVGCSNGKGRVSTAVAALDLHSMTATTVSGRTYGMVGPPSWDADAGYVMEIWMRINCVRRCKNMSQALMRRKAALQITNTNAVSPSQKHFQRLFNERGGAN